AAPRPPPVQRRRPHEGGCHEGVEEGLAVGQVAAAVAALKDQSVRLPSPLPAEAVIVGPGVGEVAVLGEARRLHGVGRLVAHQRRPAGAVEAQGRDEGGDEEEAEHRPARGFPEGAPLAAHSSPSHQGPPRKEKLRPPKRWGSTRRRAGPGGRRTSASKRTSWPGSTSRGRASQRRPSNRSSPPEKSLRETAIPPGPRSPASQRAKPALRRRIWIVRRSPSGQGRSTPPTSISPGSSC